MFLSDPEAAARARAYVRELLRKEDPPLADDAIDDVCLIASELVTNAYRYGTEPGDSLLVVVLPTLEHVRVEVHDPVRRRPQLRTDSDERARGRGLHIVDALAARWDVDDRPLGKAVWAEVAR
ncbi:ATP-binding protein [Streptomyces sp. BB1-1-1]|uniref:ATP-binding protein n=1 Tax=Streptomyces sp. BB1-1-1 TaxID=3074430 RepID=UPI002877C9D0|nr:ATP-binding protein [Streptomyces sp. BB1-1-1]WND36907.1 ATP-binding protein [Streptomyces sp. BB1-1-1]